MRFCIQVSRKIIDPNDFRNNYYVFEADQLVAMSYPNASLVRSPDMKTIGIKATKQDETPFTKEEKIALRKQLICFKNTALIVEKSFLTEEAIENCTVPVVVDFEMAEVEKEEKNGICEAEARVRAFMRMLRVKEDTVGDEGYEKNVGGKSFIKDYKKDWSTHPKVSIYIKRIRDSSNAAGAYQFMGKTYDEVIKNYGKRYKITDFSKEAQDKMCLILMKHYYTQDRPKEFYDTQSENRKVWRKRFKGQQGDIIQFVIDNDIRRAALLSSLCWASLPDSPYGQQSAKYTFADVKTIYDNYLKEELINPSNELYLKKGFLKEFGYDCCTGQSDLEVGSCNECNQDHYDIARPEHWVHQKPEECWQASIEILANYGLKNNSGYSQNRIIMADQSGTKLIPKETQKALDYIDSQLKIGKPVVVGLDDNLRKGTYNSHKATEHFFVLVGKGCEDGKRYYRFFDVGARSRELGTGKNSRLFLLDNDLLQGKSAGGSHTYTITEVRKNN
ncbi:glycoside hydrolase family 104 protein [Flavobacterium sp. LS1R47]|uniref:Glycoside hydrolase family 104 protein n=1 Tax=Flavobacterium frigoritolerans TaxID=2987686 RepID=A0A9X3CAN9_9FLAO|nr:glycoside hydrolase family 104 protein [Flavobacterium frigoritolerans]MCV9934683.1 glycoside hydrolase family 104 protein [Flavobacterium frigoritolerans]